MKHSDKIHWDENIEKYVCNNCGKEVFGKGDWCWGCNTSLEDSTTEVNDCDGL